MGNVLYEVSFQFDAAVLIPVIMLIVFAFKFKSESQKNKGTRILLAVVLCGVLAVTAVTGVHQFTMYRAVTEAYKNGTYQVVEGYVENFDPMPPEGHKAESFDINGVHFSYSDFTVMTGYHNAKSKGGVITGDGQYLKIGYIYYDVSYGNIIVYIEELPPPVA